MNELLLLFNDEVTNQVTPINHIYVDTPIGIQSIPLYNIIDITDNSVRIYINGQIGCLKLVDINNVNSSRIKIYINGVVKCLST